MSISDETLMAYADGELDAAEAEAVAAAVAADPELQARLRPFSETRRLLGGMAGDDLSASNAGDAALIAMIRAAAGQGEGAGARTGGHPAPEVGQRLAAKSVKGRGTGLHATALGGDPVTPPQAANIDRRPIFAVAAAAACALFAAGWFGLTPDSGALAPAQVAALEGLASGESRDLGEGRSMTVIASYQQSDFCREYEINDGALAEITVACRGNDGWDKRFSVNVERPESGGYTAASEGLASLDAFLAPLGEPLTPEAEAAALAQ